MSAEWPRDFVLDAVAALAPLLEASFRDPWWLIGSAALHLSGDAGVVPHDLDVLTSERDADTFRLRNSEVVVADHLPSVEDSTRFRSRFARYRFSPLPVEVMGGLRIYRDGAWLPVEIAATQVIDCGGRAIPMPTLAEQVRLLDLFGRAKDLDKACKLRNRMTKECPDVA